MNWIAYSLVFPVLEESWIEDWGLLCCEHSKDFRWHDAHVICMPEDRLVIFRPQGLPDFRRVGGTRVGQPLSVIIQSDLYIDNNELR